MSALDLLAAVRPVWLHRISHDLARGAGVRDDFAEQLTRFFDLLGQAVESGDPSWLDAVLFDWASAPTESNLKQGEHNVAQVMNRIILLTIEVARENLSEAEALELLAALMPAYTHALEKIARHEMEQRVSYVSNELVNVQQKLERLDRSKSNFIAVAAHELKTPLTLIEGYTSMIHDFVAQAEQNHMEHLLQGVNTGIRRLLEIVDNMIDVSLIDNNMLSLNFQPVMLGHILALLKREVEPSITGRLLALEIKDFPGSDQWIYADSERIYQALRNVLVNAIKYTPDGGRITIDGRTLPGFIEVTISDTGIGISPEDQALIFEKFGQVGRAELHSSGKTKFKGGGPGLGLPIARGVIEAHGGTIWVESEGCDEEKLPGSTFHLLIPARRETHDARIARLLELDTEKPEEAHGQEESPADPAAA